MQHGIQIESISVPRINAVDTLGAAAEKMQAQWFWGGQRLNQVRLTNSMTLTERREQIKSREQLLAIIGE